MISSEAKIALITIDRQFPTCAWILRREIESLHEQTFLLKKMIDRLESRLPEKGGE